VGKNPHSPTLKVTRNAKRNNDLTYRVGKAGVYGQFLLFGESEIHELYNLLTEAIKGDNEFHNI